MGCNFLKTTSISSAYILVIYIDSTFYTYDNNFYYNSDEEENLVKWLIKYEIVAILLDLAMQFLFHMFYVVLQNSIDCDSY